MGFPSSSEKRDKRNSKKLAGDYDFEAVFSYLCQMEHMEALISDAFWYYICSVKDEQNLALNSGGSRQYEAHNEFLLDRMAANYVSYTLVEVPEVPLEGKRKYFAKFYNHLAQAVFHALKLAFPKNRKEIETTKTKRKLLDMFSLLFTGITVHSASFAKWTGGSTTQQPEEEDANITLADVKRAPGGGPIKSKRQLVTLRHSTLVERYLKTHKYETFNNLKGWSMMLTQQTDAQMEIELKFKQYKQIAKNIEENSKRMAKNYEDLKKALEAKQIANDKKAKKHIKVLKESLSEKKNNGGCAEYSNMTVSIFNSEHLNNEQKS